jgi:hypothetical protein
VFRLGFVFNFQFLSQKRFCSSTRRSTEGNPLAQGTFWAKLSPTCPNWIFSRGWGRLSNEEHAFNVGEGCSQMGKKLLTKGTASSRAVKGLPLDGFSR